VDRIPGRNKEGEETIKGMGGYQFIFPPPPSSYYVLPPLSISRLHREFSTYTRPRNEEVSMGREYETLFPAPRLSSTRVPNPPIIEELELTSPSPLSSLFFFFLFLASHFLRFSLDLDFCDEFRVLGRPSRREAVAPRVE